MSGTQSIVELTGSVDPESTQVQRPLEVHPVTRLWRSALSVLGGAAGFAIVWSNPDRGEVDGWYAWAALGTFLGLVSGSSFGSGIARLRDVNAVQRVSSIRVIPAVLAFALVAVAALPLAVVVVDQGVSWRGLAIGGLAILGALPAGAALVAIRVLAIHGLHGTPGKQFAGLIRLRRLLIRLLTILGSLVVLVTLFNAAGLNWGAERVPASAVIFTGAAAALIVAMIYMPTAALLRRRSARFLDEQFPLDGVDRAGLVQAAEDRSKLEAILGLDRTTLGELQAGLLIVSPLLAGAGITLLPGF